MQNPQAAAIAATAIYKNKNNFKQPAMEKNGGAICQNADSYIITTCVSLGPNSTVPPWDRAHAICYTQPAIAGNHYSTAWACINSH